MNLYQRSCLTIDRDAPYGHILEIYKVPLSNSDNTNGENGDNTSGTGGGMEDGVVAMLIWNKSDKESVLEVTWEMMGLVSTDEYTVIDLWASESESDTLSDTMSNSIHLVIPTHGVKMLKMIPIVSISSSSSSSNK